MKLNVVVLKKGLHRKGLSHSGFNLMLHNMDVYTVLLHLNMKLLLSGNLNSHMHVRGHS